MRIIETIKREWYRAILCEPEERIELQLCGDLSADDKRLRRYEIAFGPLPPLPEHHMNDWLGGFGFPICQAPNHKKP